MSKHLPFYCFLSLLIMNGACHFFEKPTIPLYKASVIPCQPENAPTKNEKPAVRWLINSVHVPEMEVYQPSIFNATQTAVIICPGGGYGLLGWEWEGTHIAKWFNKKGITAFVLKYRLPKKIEGECKDQVALADARQAIRLVRQQAENWKLNPQKIGILGFSAGGHLAASLSCLYKEADPTSVNSINQYSARPDFSILVYPVISMQDSLTNLPTRISLLGENPSVEKIDYYSMEKQVHPQVPPTLIFHPADDKVVPVENSLKYYQQLIAYDVPAAIHIFEKGGHGFSKGGNKGQSTQWFSITEQWLRDRDLL